MNEKIQNKLLAQSYVSELMNEVNGILCVDID